MKFFLLFTQTFLIVYAVGTTVTVDNGVAFNSVDPVDTIDSVDPIDSIDSVDSVDAIDAVDAIVSMAPIVRVGVIAGQRGPEPNALYGPRQIRSVFQPGVLQALFHCKTTPVEIIPVCWIKNSIPKLSLDEFTKKYDKRP